MNGKVYLYADVMTKSIREFLAISKYRREKQLEHNRKNGITPRSVSRAVEDGLSYQLRGRKEADMVLRETSENQDVTDTIKELESEMQEASSRLEFEKAALIRDQIRELKRSAGMEVAPRQKATPTKVSYQTKNKKRRSVQLKKTTRNSRK